MIGNRLQYAVESPNFYRPMIWDSDMVLATVFGRHCYMRAGLP